MAEVTVKSKGTIISRDLSKIRALSASVLNGLAFSTPDCWPSIFAEVLNFLNKRIHEYSKIARMIHAWHKMFHCTKALGCPPDLGVFFITEFKVLFEQRHRVTNSPTRAGNTSLGIRKLACNFA